MRGSAPIEHLSARPQARIEVEGFGARMPIAPYDIHAPGILDDPAMHAFLGRATVATPGVRACSGSRSISATARVSA